MVSAWAEDSLREAIEVLVRSGRNDLASDLNRVLGNIDFEDLEVLRCPGLEQIADEILEVGSFSEFTEILERLSKLIRVDHCTLHVVNEASAANYTTKVLTTYPDNWVSRYIDRRYYLIDPVNQACRDLDQGFFWDTLDSLTPTLRSFWMDAAAFGVGPAGYSLPIITERGDKLAISVSSTIEPGPFRETFGFYQSDLFSLGIFISDAFIRLASVDHPLSFNPSDDQLSVLRAIAMGATEEDLKARSYQFGSFITIERSINTLFRTKTLAQAAVLAARIGILANAPLTKADVLASSERTAANRVVVNPNCISIRRLVRLRSVVPAQEPVTDPADFSPTIVRFGG